MYEYKDTTSVGGCSVELPLVRWKVVWLVSVLHYLVNVVSMFELGQLIFV